MDSNIIGQSSAAQTVATAKFAALTGSGASFGAAALGGAASTMPTSGTLKNLYIKMDTGDATNTRTFVVQKSTNNGTSFADTAITVTIATSATTGNDTTHTDTFNAGDMYTLKTTAAGTTTSTGTIRWTLAATCAANTSMVLGATANNLATGATTYVALAGIASDATANNVESVMPTGGTFKNAYVVQAGSSGTGGSGKSYAYTLVINGSDTAITMTDSETAVAASDTTHSVSVAAGDRVYWKVVPTATPTARQAHIGLEFDPTTNGESVQLYGGGVVQTNSAVRYQGLLSNAGIAYGTADTARQSLTQAATWKNLYVYEQSILLAGTYQYQLDKNATAGNPSVTMTTASQSGNDTSNTVTTAAGDTVSMSVTPALTPTAVAAEWGIVSYIAPPAASTVKQLSALGVG